MKLSDENRDLVVNNQKLVYLVIQRNLGIAPNSPNYEDIVSIGTIGLAKAVVTYDPSKGITFSSYATKCIRNEIFMYFRRERKYEEAISLDQPIEEDDWGKSFTLGDKISTPDFVEEIINKEVFSQIVSIIINYLAGKTRLAILYWLGKMPRTDIAMILKISPNNVSKTVTKGIKKIQEVMNRQKQVPYKELFSFSTSIIGDEYRISFSPKISEFNKIFATVLQNLTPTEELPNFRICSGEKILLHVHADHEAFSFIADIIRKTDDIVKRGSGSEKVRNYILSVDSFTIRELKRLFPEIPDKTIRIVVFQATRKGLIIGEGKGKYRVVNPV